MATAYADAERMLAAQRSSGRVAVMGYNYIQNDANATYNFYVNRFPVAVGANPNGFVLGTVHSF